MNELFFGNWIDITVTTIIVLSVTFGIWRGLFASVAGIMTLIFAVIVARFEIGIIHGPLESFFGDSPVVPLIATVFIFFLAFFVFGLVARLVVKVLNEVDVGGFNRVGGGLFGFLRGVLLAMLFMLAISALGAWQSTAWQESRTMPPLGVLLKGVSALPPLQTKDYGLEFDDNHRPRLRQQEEPTMADLDNALAADETDDSANASGAVDAAVTVSAPAIDASEETSTPSPIAENVNSQSDTMETLSEDASTQNTSTPDSTADGEPLEESEKSTEGFVIADTGENDSALPDLNRIRNFLRCELQGKDDCRL